MDSHNATNLITWELIFGAEAMKLTETLEAFTSSEFAVFTAAIA